MSTRIPSYRKHRTGQARVTIQGRTYYMGAYGTEESKRAYKAIINEWLTKTGRFAPPTGNGTPACTTNEPSVNEITLAYIQHAEVYYQTNPKEVEKIVIV